MLIRRTLHLCLRKLPRPSYIIPHLQADIASHILAFLGYLQTCSGFFASSLAIIRLYKLSTLSLRSFPPLKPFERRDYSNDIHGFFVYIAIYGLICIAPLVNKVVQGELDDRRSD